MLSRGKEGEKGIRHFLISLLAAARLTWDFNHPLALHFSSDHGGSGRDEAGNIPGHDEQEGQTEVRREPSSCQDAVVCVGSQEVKGHSALKIKFHDSGGRGNKS